ncbi:MAG: SUMF1/EgtB/PvdO family nonheme iron enzyme, partial [Anaerolineae bacterium]|nr:SUMF1/EgtB/PvdO family nonheme iron enzyme [Anaerolineae bacterium]
PQTLATTIQAEVAGDAELREALDAVLAKLELVPSVQQSLSITDQKWLTDILQQELTQLGTPSNTIETIIGRGNLIIQGSEVSGGDESIVASIVGRDAITGDGNQITNIVNIYRRDKKEPPDEATLRKQITGYLGWMIDKYSKIELRGIKREGRQVVQLDLETVYVPLAAKTYGAREIQLDQVLQQGRRLAIIGGPGSGKTTVLLHLAYTLSVALGTDKPDLAETRLGLKDDLPLPLFIPLSSYAHYLRDLPSGSPGDMRTLAAFISDYLLRRQTGFDLPTDFFQQLLRTGRQVILLLDGLDEVPDEAERAEVRQAIEDLLRGREKLRLVVTCRTAAYKGRTALGGGFQEIHVLPLDENHLTGLVQQAYASPDLFGADRQTAENKANELLVAIDSLEAQRRRLYGEDTEPLVTSPLLVRMLLVVHYSERRLPDQRAELYMKATDAMLLPEYTPDEEVANRLGGLVGESQSVHRELVQYLAFEMHQRGSTQGREIDEDDLRQVLDNHPTYPHLTSDLITLTKQRGTLLEERLGQYRFIHLAFQEYLVARYLAETVRSDSGLNGIAAFLEEGPILDSWWREPALLVCGYLSIGTPGMAQKFLRRLAGLDPRPHEVAADTVIAAVEITCAAAAEWPTIPANFKHDLLNHVTPYFNGPNEVMAAAKPGLRAALGHTLARLGDPRPGVITVNNMEFCYIPPGPFMMGSPDEDDMASSNEKPLHEVDIPYGYWLSRYPVTVAQFKEFVELSGHQPQDEDSLRGAVNHPVVYVTWREAIAFGRWLTGRWQDQGRLPQDWQVTLPSEAEWEKAARGGLNVLTSPHIQAITGIAAWQSPVELTPNEQSQRRYPWGDAPEPKRANYSDTGIGGTSAVGCFSAGASVYGCEEMSGNVWEWCRTKWQDSYEAYLDDNNLEGGAHRVLRGGSYDGYQLNVRCAARLDLNPGWDYWYYGFRLVVAPFTSDR